MYLKALPIFALVLLAACGGGGGGGQSSGNGGGNNGGSDGDSGGDNGGGTGGSADPAVAAPVPQSEVFATAGATQPFAIDQALRGNPDFAASSTAGVTGIMAFGNNSNENLEFREVSLTLSEDRSTLRINIEGLAEFELAVDAAGTIDGGDWGRFFREHVILDHGHDSGSLALTDITPTFDVNIGRGVYGLSTPIERLPTGGVVYGGDWLVNNYLSSAEATDYEANGEFQMTVSFGDGTISGTTTGKNHLDISEDGTGVITGTVSGNDLSGTLTLESANGSTNLTYQGDVFGWNAENVGGALIGTTANNGISNPVIGTFQSDNPG